MCCELYYRFLESTELKTLLEGPYGLINLFQLLEGINKELFLRCWALQPCSLSAPPQGMPKAGPSVPADPGERLEQCPLVGIELTERIGHDCAVICCT